jgi:hypothetical protein
VAIRVNPDSKQRTLPPRALLNHCGQRPEKGASIPGSACMGCDNGIYQPSMNSFSISLEISTSAVLSQSSNLFHGRTGCVLRWRLAELPDRPNVKSFPA